MPPKQKGVAAFLREYIDTYIVTTGNSYNLQVWNRNPNSASVLFDLKFGESVLASDVRFVLGKIKLNDPTWYASLRGVSGSVAYIVCMQRRKSNRKIKILCLNLCVSNEKFISTLILVLSKNVRKMMIYQS